MAIVKNVVNLQAAFEALAGRDHGIPGMGLVHGHTGAGKSTATAWLVNRTSGVYVRANATWTPTAMLGAIMTELGFDPIYPGARMVDHIVRHLAMKNRPLFVDEADYLLHNTKMIETLRDVHDVSACPVVLIGMEGIDRKIIHRQQLARRISQWVEFQPADFEDAQTVAKTLCEIDISTELLRQLHEQAKGSIGLIVVGLSRIETLAKGNGWKKVDERAWGDRPLFLSRAPKAALHR